MFITDGIDRCLLVYAKRLSVEVYEADNFSLDTVHDIIFASNCVQLCKTANPVDYVENIKEHGCPVFHIQARVLCSNENEREKKKQMILEQTKDARHFLGIGEDIIFRPETSWNIWHIAQPTMDAAYKANPDFWSRMLDYLSDLFIKNPDECKYRWISYDQSHGWDRGKTGYPVADIFELESYIKDLKGRA